MQKTKKQPPAPATDPQKNVENEKPRSRWDTWDTWVAKNALPKNHYFPKKKRSLTRFQKPGPMSERDWKRFSKWAIRRSRPKRVFHQRKPEEKKRKPLAKIMRRIQRLSVPKHSRNKYQAPPEPIYPFSPKIHYKKPARHDKGRPIQPIKLPYWWAHEELEIDFWRWMRFPISRNALKYRTTNRNRKMAIPKSYPIKEHCNVPDRDFSPPDRVKMTPKQWKEHLTHLEYLADASFKVSRQMHLRCMPQQG